MGYYIVTKSGDRGPYEREQIQVFAQAGKLRESHQLRVEEDMSVIQVGELVNFDRLGHRAEPREVPQRRAPVRQARTTRESRGGSYRGARVQRRRGPSILVVILCVIGALAVAGGGWYLWQVIGVASIKEADFDLDWPGGWPIAIKRDADRKWSTHVGISQSPRRIISVSALSGVRASRMGELERGVERGLLDSIGRGGPATDWERESVKRLGLVGRKMEAALSVQDHIFHITLYFLHDQDSRAVGICGMCLLEDREQFTRLFERTVDSFKFR